MPISDFIKKHITATDKQAADDLINQLRDLLMPYTHNLTAEEKTKYGSINEKNKLLVNKVRDYNQAQPNLSSPDVDWTEYEADWQDRVFLQTRAETLQGLVEMLDDTRVMHDHDNYQNALTDYSYTKYKDNTGAGQGFTTKYNELKQFFPHTTGGGGNAPDEDVPPAP